MITRLVCPRCDAGLVPSWSGLRCPRMSACGRGGLVEAGGAVVAFAPLEVVPTGVEA